MKPLELVNYGPFKEGPNGSRIFHGPRKRLTDADLAAEFWRQSTIATAAASNYLNSGPGQTDAALDYYQREAGKLEALQRFATHPHYYDEADQ